MKRLSGHNFTLDTLLSAVCADQLALLIWKDTKDGRHGRNKPKSISRLLMNGGGRKEPELKGFKTPEAFEAYWKSHLKETDNGK